MLARYGLMAAIAMLLNALPVYAQSRPDTLKPDAPVVRIDTLRISVTLPFITRGGASAMQVRPDSLRLGPALTVDRVVRELPFVQVRTNARGESYFALRGSSFDAREVAVLIDGLPVSLGFDHRADLAVLPATGVTSLTMVRGIPALLYGPNVLGGVVELTLSDAQAASHALTLNAGYDNTGGYALSGNSSVLLPAGSGRVIVRGGGGYRQSSGYPLPADVREPAPFADRDLRLNSDRLQRDGFASARYVTGGGAWLSVSGLGYSADRGTPAELNTTNPHFWRYPETRRTIGSASMGSGTRTAPWGGSLRVEGSAGYDVGHIELDNFTSRSYTTVHDREIDDDRNVTARGLAVQTVGRGGEVSSALTYADVRRDENLTGTPSRYRQLLHSAALEAGWRFDLGDGARLRLHGGLAHDGANTPSSADKPAVAAMDVWGSRVGFAASTSHGRLLLHGGIGRRARFPSLRELYSGALKMFEPNPELRPEILVASELGSTVQLGGTQLQAVAFRHRIEDAIVRTTTPTKRIKRVNRDETRSTGLELLAVAPVWRAIISTDVTMQDVRSSDPADDREFRPEYQPKFAGGLRVNTPLLWNARLDLSARGTGAQYCISNTGAYTRLASSVRSDAQLSRAWHVPAAARFSAIETAIAIDNLTDAAIYDQCGLPQPGRLLRLRLQLR